jgi:hypothetical protein
MRKTILVLGAVMAVLMFAMVGAGVALADTVFSTSTPTTAEDCKNGGYAKYGFKNQGQCIKAVNHATPADTTAPEIQITDGPAEGSVSNEGRFFISSNEPVQFFYDIREATYTGQPTYSTLGNPNSTEVDIGFTLSNADGKEMVLYIKAVDAAGNTTEIQRRWTVDITGPTVQFTGGPSEGEVLTNNDVTFSWTASDPAPGSGVDQVLGCMNFIPEPGGHENYGTCRTSSPTTYTDMPDGNYQFILAATDRAGNQGEAIVRNFTVDTTP